jgi:exopolysaccharide biosynthesis polyprenyl glycosylphosphotransferase
MLGRQSGVWGLLLFLVDAGVVVGCFLAAFYLKKHYVLPDPHLDLDLYRQLLAVEAPFVMAVLLLSGLYSSRALLSGLGRQFRMIAKTTLLVFAVFVVISFYAKLFSYSRAVFTLYFLLLAPALMLPRLMLYAFRRLLGRGLRAARRILVLGDSQLTHDLRRKLSASPYCTFDVVRAPAGGPGALAEIEQGRVDSVVIDLPFEEIGAISAIAGRAEKEGLNVYLTPRAFPATLLNASLTTVGGIPFVALHAPDLPLVGKIVKRAMDLTVSLAGLVLLAPLMLIATALIRLTSRGPALYRQRRVGLDGREFTMLKFRTMVDDAEGSTGPVWAERDDPRCTGVGRWLRRTNLDELPQLLNVLAGSMSLVGPRPERPELVRRFKEDIERYAHKHWVKPGMTGWAQVNGWRGPTDLEERIRHDLWYVENWSPWLDARIVAATLATRLRGRAPGRRAAAPGGDLERPASRAGGPDPRRSAASHPQDDAAEVARASHDPTGSWPRSGAPSQGRGPGADRE